jgi:hypothetical protein
MATQIENNTTGLEELLTIANELSEAPVKSVNNKTGHVVLTPSDIGAAESDHKHQISELEGGRFTKIVRAGIGCQTALDSLLRNSCVSPNSSTAPAGEGEICWIYN